MKTSMCSAAILMVLMILPGLGCRSDPIVTVHGMVEDSVNQVGIPGAIVAAGTYSAVTDAAGEYKLAMPYGRATFRITAQGYKAQGQQIVIGPEKTCFLFTAGSNAFSTTRRSSELARTIISDTIMKPKRVDKVLKNGKVISTFPKRVFPPMNLVTAN